ncbi:MAG: Tol-Pal system beta propeller repeat protein TolB [Gammaproteobacteria bacterium]|nr:Tol-Pal system beta propeller repeat protein TolB [Gammaproteobacteria bacterium]
MRAIGALAIAAFFSINTAFADLTINIVQGVDKPYPIAIVPFNPALSNLPDLPQGFTAVIQNDLSHSGRFEVLPVADQPGAPHEASEVDWAKWRSAAPGTEYALLGEIKPAGGNDYDVSYSVLSLYNHQVLYGQHFNGISAHQLRALAHFVSDKAYQIITGQRGYFSTRLAYVSVVGDDPDSSVYRLTISDSDGYRPQVLLKQVGNPIASPTWSPDGKDLAYVTYVNNRMAVYTIELATGRRTLIANFPGMNSAPAFSPDGKYLAMALSHGASSDMNLVLLDLATNRLTAMTNEGTNTSPNFSPDSRTLVFTSDRGGSPQVYQMNLSTREVKRLTFEGVQNFDPHYLADGQNIVFMHQETGDGPINIALMNLQSGQQMTLTQGNLDKSPSPAPNGQMVIYANYDGEHGILAETTIDGRMQLQLPATVGSVQSPAWSPFLS